MWADERFLLLHLRGPQSSSQGSEGFRGHLGAGPQPLAGVAVLTLTMALRVKTELPCSSAASNNVHWKRPQVWVTQVGSNPRSFEFLLLNKLS